MGEPILLPYQQRWINDKSPLKIWLASRQVGKSFCLALEAVTEALERKCNNLILSASERQSREVMLKVYSHLRYLNAISEELINADDGTKEEVSLPNGSRIISLPASPDTVRGFSGNVFLDEFAFHRDAEDIWRAMYPTITRGYKLRISSTPNGKQNMFYEIWSSFRHSGESRNPESEKLDSPVKPGNDKLNGWSKHRTDIYTAVTDGLKADPDALRAGINDADSWAQEFECRFLDEATAFITYEMIASCEDGAAIAVIPASEARRESFLKRDSGQAGMTDNPPSSPFTKGGQEGDYFLGVDVGRKHDLTVFWLVEKVGDVLWTRMVREMHREPFRVQREFLYGLMNDEIASASPRNDVITSDHRERGNRIRRCCIDSTGIGAQMAEEAAEKFGSRVEAVTFTSTVKEDLAITLKRNFEERLVRIPADRDIREDLHSVRKFSTYSGNSRFDAARSEGSHADRFWALALAIHAAGAPPVRIEYETLIRRSRPVVPALTPSRWQTGAHGCW